MSNTRELDPVSAIPYIITLQQFPFVYLDMRLKERQKIDCVIAEISQKEKDNLLRDNEFTLNDLYEHICDLIAVICKENFILNVFCQDKGLAHYIQERQGEVGFETDIKELKDYPAPSDLPKTH